MKKKPNYKQVQSLEELKQLAAESNEFFIQLNGGLISRKQVHYDYENHFWILNYIDETEQELTDAQIMDKDYTNIGEAISKGAFWYDADELVLQENS